MIKSKEDLLKVIKDRVGEDTTDETLSFIEDVTDTLNEYENLASANVNWKKKYEDNDAEWRAKYRDRFFNTEVKEEPIQEEEIVAPEKPKTFDNLFELERI